MLGGKFALCLFVMIAPIVACAADHCTNPDEYTIDKRCYVTDEQKKEKPFSAVVSLVDGLGTCTGTIIKRHGLTSENTGYFVYTAKHCVSEHGGPDVQKQIQMRTQSGQLFTADLVKFGGYVAKDQSTYHGDWAIYRLLPSGAQSNSKFTVGDELGNAYTNIDGVVGQRYQNARLIGYGTLPIASDVEIEDFRSEFLEFLKEYRGYDEVDENSLNFFIQAYFDQFNWNGFVGKKDTELKVSYCSYSDKDYTNGNTLDCQAWGGDSGGGIFDDNGNLMGILTRAARMIGTTSETFAPVGDNIDFKRFGKLKNGQK